MIRTLNDEFGPVYAGKTILITGSVGTVGSEVLRQILEFKPAEVRLFDNNESGLFMQMQYCENEAHIQPFLGDIRDLGKLYSAMHGVQIVFHLSAYKHVYLCECNPFDSVRTNVIGTQNVLKAALDAKVDRLLYTSSDKAVNPTNVMGTSKLLAERVVTASTVQTFNKKPGPLFASTRFGNVLGSNGSVIPIFVEQIKQGGPLTITNPNMTRFIMTIQEAARLVIKAAAIARGGEVFVTKMPVVSIADLAAAVIEILAPCYGRHPEEIKMKTIGPRPGEKIYEELMSEEEVARAVELTEMFSVLPALRNGDRKIFYNYPCLVSQEVQKPYISKNEPLLSKQEIIDYLLTNHILGDELSDHYQVIRQTQKEGRLAQVIA